MIALAKIAVLLLADALRLVILSLRSCQSLTAENLILRRQLALCKERGSKPGRIDSATRVSLTLLATLFDWRDGLIVVRPETLLRWHRVGWRLLWRYKCRAGRPPIPAELRALIRRMANENPLWGEERIANEFVLKLGLRVSPRTVRKYMPKRPMGRPRGDQQWSTFLAHYNGARPHTALSPEIPDPPRTALAKHNFRNRLCAQLVVRDRSVLGGLHHEYALVATAG